MAACDGTLVSGEESLLSQETTGIVVAAMTLPHVLDRLFDGAVVVTPGDRPEVVLGVLTAQVSANFPQMAGIVLNGGFDLPEQVTRLIDGLDTTMPIVATKLDTSDATQALDIGPRPAPEGARPARWPPLSRSSRSASTVTLLLDRLEVARTRAVTPLMFEHQLIDMAVGDRRHIVLPEGDDDRILQAADILLRRKVADLTILGEPRRDPAAGRPARRRPLGRSRCSARSTRSCGSGSPRSTTNAASTRASTSSVPATSSSMCPTSAP